MQNWSRIDNPLIKGVDNIAKSSELQSPLKNTLKTLVKIQGNRAITTNIYKNKFTLDIPRGAYDNLAQLYIKATLSTGSVASTLETYFATRIFKSITLRTKQGFVLQKITPEYSQARIDEVYGSELYTHLTIGLEPDVTFLAGNPTCIIPLFFFFSEDDAVFLPTRSLEALEIEFVINDNKEAMTMSVDLTSAQFDLYALYHDTNESNKFDDLIYTKKSIPKTIKGSYNIFEEDLLTCPTGSTSAKLLLRCPFPLYVLHTSLISSTGARRTIKSVKITTGGSDLIDFDYRMNYQMYGDSKAYVENGTVSLFFNKLKRREVDSGLLTFSKEMFPCYLEITFDALPAAYTLYAFEEYRTKFGISDTGIIGLSPAEDLQQLNSSMEFAKLLDGY